VGGAVRAAGIPDSGSSVGLLAASAWLISMAALQPSIAVLQVAIVGVRFFGISRGVFRYLERLASHQVTFRVLARLRTWFYAAIEPLAPARLAERRSGDLLSRIVADTGALENFYIRAVAPPLVAVLVALLLVALLGAYHPRLVAPFLGLYALAGVGLPLLTWALGRGPGRALSSARAALNAGLVDGVQGVADLKAFGAEERYLARLQVQGAALGRLGERLAGITALGNAAGSGLAWLAAGAVLAVAVPLVSAGELPGVVLALLALAVMAGFEAVLPLPAAAGYWETSMTAGRRLLELVEPASSPDRPLVSRRPEAGATTFSPSPDGRGERGQGSAIGFSHVTLRYLPGEPPALDDVTFEVPAGGLVAVVGASGAGKSTLINALLRFWDYEAGEITLGGVELRDLAPEDVRKQIGVVSQRTHLFNATVRDNLLLARPAATQGELEEACRAAQIHDFIAGLPGGYGTWIGENGLRLSGGERQRLAVARALLKDAPLLVLDEPGANLDAATEAALWEALAPLLPGRTTLLVTHRLDAIPEHAKIVVLERGRSFCQR
jgi:ATP-binding cassette, subfamily C, bacterial CydC